jgi:biopolymer transport protein ExbB
MFAGLNWYDWISNSPVFLVLVLCSVVTLAAGVERARYFASRRGDCDACLAASLRKIKIGELSAAATAIEATPHPLASVAGQVFAAGSNLGATLDERLTVTLSQQKMLFEKNLGLLGTMAAVAPLIGLLGTIWGIIRAFHDIGATGSTAPAVVASGLAEALITTAVGIMIAVPAILAYNHFTGRMNIMLTTAENGARSLRAAILEAAS